VALRVRSAGRTLPWQGGFSGRGGGAASAVVAGTQAPGIQAMFEQGGNVALDLLKLVEL